MCNVLRKVQLFLMVIFFSFLGQAGDSVNNGGGLAEQNFWLAYSKLEVVFQACLDSSDCFLDASERSTLQSLLVVVGEEKKTVEQVRFISDQSNSFFLDDSQVLVARTNFTVGSIIWVNRDLIYQTNLSGQVTAYTVFQAFGVLTEQLLAHQSSIEKLHRHYIAMIIQNFYQKHQREFYFIDLY